MPTPEELLMAQQLGMLAAPSGEVPPPAPQPALVPMQVGGVGAFANPATGAITAPDVTSTTTKDPTSSETHVPKTPAIAAASGKLAGSEEQALAAQDRKTSQAIQEETFRAEQKDREAQQAKAQLAELQAANKASDERLAEATQRVRARQEEYRNFKPTSYVEDMGTLRRVLSAIGMGLGHYSSAMTGAPNTAYQIYASQENAHREKQKAIAEKKAQEIEMATGDVNAANDFRRRTLATINDRYLATNAYLQRQIDGKIARIPKAAADGEATKAALARDYGKAELEQANLLAGHKTTQEKEVSQTVVQGKTALATEQPGGKVTEAESKKAQYAAGMQDSIRVIKEAKEQLTEDDLRQLNANIQSMRAQVESATKGIARPFWNSKLQAAGILPEQFTEGIDDEKGPLVNAWLNATGLLIRDQSGAAITNAEDFTNSQKKMPQPKDGPKAVAEKLRVIELDASNMERLAGKEAYYRLHGEYPSWAQPQQPSAPAQTPEAIKARNRAEARKIAKADPVPPRDFAQERKDILRARAILKDPKSTPAQRAAAERYQVQMGID